MHELTAYVVRIWSNYFVVYIATLHCHYNANCTSNRNMTHLDGTEAAMGKASRHCNFRKIHTRQRAAQRCNCVVQT